MVLVAGGFIVLPVTLQIDRDEKFGIFYLITVAGAFVVVVVVCAGGRAAAAGCSRTCGRSVR